MNATEPFITLVSCQVPVGLQWPYGGVELISEWNVHTVNEVISRCQSRDGFTLFWDFSVPLPPLNDIIRLCSEPRDIWHAGQKSTTAAYDPLLRFARPCWMLNLRIPPETGGVSWRVDFRHALIRNRLFNGLGGLDSKFRSLSVAGLEFGYRTLISGGIPVHVPTLLPYSLDTQNLFPEADHIHFARLHLTRFWATWAIARGVMTGEIGILHGMSGMLASSPHKNTRLVVHKNETAADKTARVSVVIITLGRYQHLQHVIGALLHQTIAPFEIIVVDATPEGERVNILESHNQTGKNIQVIYVKIAGQCSQRNIGIRQANGEFILFMDDDMTDIPENHIEKHLKNLKHWQADVSCGTPDEVGALPVDRLKSPLKVSDVFPTCDTMVRKTVLDKAGYFDEKMDRGMSEDHELGTRIYLSGAIMLLDPELKSLHLRAPGGGLRAHGSRVITYGSARTKLLHRRIPHVTEIYLRQNFFSNHEVRESLFLSALGTFSIIGGWHRKVLKIIISAFLLPNTICEIRRRTRLAVRLSNLPIKSRTSS